MQRRPIAFVGDSGSGKTELICRLIPILVGRGDEVGVIKHTHHEVNELKTGDTARFLAAGAAAALLADDFQAVHFDATGTSKWAYGHPTDLLRIVKQRTVFVEGFKSFEGWHKVIVEGDELPLWAPDAGSVVAVVTSGNAAGHVLPQVPRFQRSQLGELVEFLDRIAHS